ncbi:hypothetical protein [Sphingomonas sp.]|uniref:hypothetical protein n=1 Tax=Sphingomonas sp. TaxID=28214 RepID=UPI001B28CDD5|nr:hypothetical protein [Sphingomonas sp.]MBO9713836.1 hypothetical protein [Sphingomonas sp.]
MKLFATTAGLALALGAPTAALAQDAAAPPAQAEAKGPEAGATVYDPQGNEAGTIVSISGNVAVFSTGTNQLGIPLDRFGKSPKGPTIALTKPQLDALAEQAKTETAAKVRAKLTPGAEVRGSNGAVLAKVKGSAGDNVTLTAENGGRDVQVPISGLAADDMGLTINMTAEQFAAAVAAAG